MAGKKPVFNPFAPPAHADASPRSPSTPRGSTAARGRGRGYAAQAPPGPPRAQMQGLCIEFVRTGACHSGDVFATAGIAIAICRTENWVAPRKIAKSLFRVRADGDMYLWRSLQVRPSSQLISIGATIVSWRRFVFLAAKIPIAICRTENWVAPWTTAKSLFRVRENWGM